MSESSSREEQPGEAGSRRARVEAESDRLKLALADHIERNDYRAARDTVAALLRLKPTDVEALEAQDFLNTQPIEIEPLGEYRQFSGHLGTVSSVAFSPDGRQALSGGGGDFLDARAVGVGDFTVRLWDINSGAEVRRFKGHASAITSVAFSPTGNYALTALRGIINVWDPQSGRFIRKLPMKRRLVLSAVFSPDGQHIVSGSEDRVLRLWDVASGKRLVRFTGHGGSITSVAFLGKGERILSGSLDRTVRLWNPKTGLEINRFTGHTLGLLSVASSPDGRYLLSGGLDNTARLWDAESGRQLRCLEGHTGAIHSVAFAPDGRWLLTASGDRTIRLWEAASGREIGRFAGHAGGVKSAVFSPDGHWILSASADHSIRLCHPPLGIVSMEAFVQALGTSRLLTAAQLAQFQREIQPRFRQLPTLAQHLVALGWLNPYQVDQLIQGRGEELKVGTYTVLEWLGRGGMGQVYKARHADTGDVVALKIIHPELLSDAAAVKQFRWENRAIAGMAHANIVRTFEAGKEGDKHFFAMECVEGTDLEKLVQLFGPLPIPEACDYIRQAALGLQHAHERCLVHRDIKPANLLVHGSTGDDEHAVPPGARGQWVGHAVLKILDWGLASLRPPAGRRRSTSAETKEDLVGTADYIAPEQATNPAGANIRADVYSLGCTLYFLLSGRVPFPGGSLMQKLLKHQKSEPAPVTELRSEVPAALVSVLHRMMAKRPEDRYQTPAAVATALAPFCRLDESALAAQDYEAADLASDEDLEPSDEPEPRGSERYPCNLEISCRRAAASADIPSPAWPGNAQDISKHGISVVLGYQFEPGTLLAIEVRNASSGVPRTLQARVVHVRPRTGGKWLLGCSLAGELSEKELEAMRMKGSRSSTIFRRAWVRIPIDAQVPAQAGMPNEQWPAKVFNISASGIGLTVPRAFERGTILSIELKSRTSKSASTALVRVVHAAVQADGDWALGCAFASEPGDDELKALLS
jgi:serine/threonine protein kinase